MRNSKNFNFNYIFIIFIKQLYIYKIKIIIIIIIKKEGIKTRIDTLIKEREEIKEKISHSQKIGDLLTQIQKVFFFLFYFLFYFILFFFLCKLYFCLISKKIKKKIFIINIFLN